MDVKKFQLAMRPKKYLTHDFLVYQDPKMQAARSEMQAGGIVQREGFYKAGLATSGPNKGKWTVKDVWDPVKKTKGTKVFKTEEAANKFIKELKYKSDKFYKSRVILDNPKKKESFLKYANKPGVTTKDIRNKYGLSKDEFFNGGLRDIIDKDFASQRRIQPKTVDNMLKLHNDKEAMDYIRKGKIVPDEVITKLGIKPYAAATATVRLAQHYGGQDFGYDELNDIRRNKSASQKLFTAMDKFKFGNPYHSNLYNISLELIDDKLGNERGTFNQLKTKARELLAKNKIEGFDINEIAGVVGSAKSDAAEFSQFIDVMESKLNQEEMASFQSAFSRARENLKNNPENFKTISKNINKLAKNFEDRYGVSLPRIGKAEDVEKFYSKKRLAELKEQGLDIVQASKRAGYTIKMPKGAITIQEFTNNPETMRAVIGSLSDDPACALPAKAEGGRIGFQKGSDLCYQQGLKKLDEARKNPGAAAKLKGKLGKAAKGFGKVLRFLELPFEVAIEGLLVGDAMLRGQSFERAVKGNTLLMRALMPGGYSTSADEQRIKEISENNPAVKTYFEAKQRADKYQELVNRVEQNEKIAAGLVAPEDVGLTTSNLEESKKELNDFIQNNFQNFDRDKEILNPEGYFAQQADQAARDYVSKEVYESGYGKGQVAAREAQIEDPLADFVQPEQEFEKERLEESQEQVDQFGFIPTEQEFMQGLNKDAMKGFVKNRYPNMDEQQLNMLTDFAIQQQYQNIRNPFAVYDYSRNVQASPFAVGGRVGFSNGGGMRRRTFLKLMAGVGAALGALKSGIIKLSSPVAKKVLKDAPAGTPDWFAPLVDKIMREGVDAGETMKTVTGRETVKKLEVPTEGAEGALTDKYFLYENPDTGEIRVDIDIPGAGANDEEFSIFMRPDRVEGVNDDGTPMLSEGEFFLAEERATGVQSGPDDWDMELLSTDVGLEDSASDWYRVEKFATGKTDEAARQKKLKYKQDIEADPTQDIIDRQGEYDYSSYKDQDIDE